MKLWWDRGTGRRPGTIGWMKVMSHSAHLDWQQRQTIFSSYVSTGTLFRTETCIWYLISCAHQRAPENIDLSMDQCAISNSIVIVIIVIIFAHSICLMYLEIVQRFSLSIYIFLSYFNMKLELWFCNIVIYRLRWLFQLTVQ